MIAYLNILTAALVLSLTLLPLDGNANIQLVSKALDGTGAANGLSRDPAISGDGTVIAFSSRATNLTPVDANGSTFDVYVYDSERDVTESITPGGDGDSFVEGISGDGRVVLFFSNASNLVPSDPNGAGRDLFVFDRTSGITEVLAPDANGLLRDPDISFDGRYVVFSSTATNLTGADENGRISDIFLLDRQSRSVELLIQGGNGFSGSPSISGDGRYVAFYTFASNLVLGDPNGSVIDVYVYDRTTRTLENLTAFGALPGLAPSISNDGRFVAFETIPRPSQVIADVAVFDRDLLKLTTLTKRAELGASRPDISADGRFITFQSSSTRLVPRQRPANGPRPDVFVADRLTGAIRGISTTGDDVSQNPSASSTASRIAFRSRADFTPGGFPSTGGRSGDDIYLYSKAEDPSPAICGEPSFDSTIARGLFIWRDCEDTDRYFIRAVAGGSADRLVFRGTITAEEGAFDAMLIDAEPDDSLTILSATELEFELRVRNAGTDGLSFTANGSACAEFDALEGLPIFIGRDSVVAAADKLDLQTGVPCVREPVVIDDWLSQVGGMSVNGNALTYVGSPIGWKNSATSARLSTLGLTESYEVCWEIVSNPAATTWVVGLGIRETTRNWRDVDFGLRSLEGRLTVYENGNYRKASSFLKQGDVISIKVDGAALEYRHNGQTFANAILRGPRDFYIDTAFKNGAVDLSVFECDTSGG